MAKILLVEDDHDLLDLLEISLKAQGHQVQRCDGGSEALGMLRVYKFDLLILDWMMPEITGTDVCRQYREMGGKTPVLMLTAKAASDDKVHGLDAGADDYLTKPFNNKELHARVRALLRRPAGVTETVLEYGAITLNPASCEVCKAGKQIHLRPKVYDLLEFFFRHPDQVFTADALLERVWMDDSTASADTVRTHIKLLRRSIQDVDDSADLIDTVRGKGYVLRGKKQPR
ncbi:MAG: response regulator transcription factor [Candidatus Obscuribacterales bacterium]|nr:response regulator transcription factor [Candidatus Obscuribacterales bacterium]